MRFGESTDLGETCLGEDRDEGEDGDVGERGPGERSASEIRLNILNLPFRGEGETGLPESTAKDLGGPDTDLRNIDLGVPST